MLLFLHWRFVLGIGTFIRGLIRRMYDDIFNRDFLHTLVLRKQCIDHSLIYVIFDSIFFNLLVLLFSSFPFDVDG